MNAVAAGYTNTYPNSGGLFVFAHVECGSDWTFVPIGSKTQPGDEVYTELGWCPIKLSGYGLIIHPSFAPVRRKIVKEWHEL